MSLLNRLRQTVKQSQFLERWYHLFKAILEVNLFYLVREGLSYEDGVDVKPKLDLYDVIFLKPSDMKAISTSPEVPQTEDALVKRLSEGCLCIGIKHYDEIAAYMWCNLRECDSLVMKFNLKADEAYLKDARTFSSYKGKSLAPYLRTELYKHLRQMGRTKFISLTSYFNTSAQRFKKKLNAKPQKLYVWFKFFMKYEWAIPLKNFKI
jgi:hypothetical protein